MYILGIETSCDETAAAVIQTTDKQTPVNVLSSVLATSLALHAKTGGIIPEVAAREQVKAIIPIIKQAFFEAKKTQADIDAIAVTYGPGLIGSLLVGVETAKTLAYAWGKPIIPVNHLFGHIYANWIDQTPLRGSVNDKAIPSSLYQTNNNKIATGNDTSPSGASPKDGLARNNVPIFPAVALIVSGGHTDLVLMKNHNDILWLGGTRDDAAGEAFDKIGRELNFPYPAGPAFERAAAQGNPKRFQFPRPLKHDSQYDFSFSGLKTAAIREIYKYPLLGGAHASGGWEANSNNKQKIQSKDKIHLDSQTISDITRGVQDAIIDVLVYKAMKAAEEYNAQSILLGGGVAANQTLRNAFLEAIDTQGLPVTLHVPDRKFCTDNAAMIATAAYFMGKETPWQEITANPELYFD